jgi:N-acetyl-anhydromuramyl-L-alanine amidase AmpD
MTIRIPGLSRLHTMSAEQLNDLLKEHGYKLDDESASVVDSFNIAYRTRQYHRASVT